MAVNPLIRKKIEGMNIPVCVKSIINEVLTAKDTMYVLGEDKKRSYDTIGKILIRYDDDAEVKKFCGGND